MAHRPDIVQRPVDRAVARGCPVELEPDDLAEMALPVLRGFHLLAVAAGKEDVLPIGAEGDAVRIMPAPGHLGGLAPDHGEIVDPAAVGQRA